MTCGSKESCRKETRARGCVIALRKYVEMTGNNGRCIGSCLRLRERAAGARHRGEPARNTALLDGRMHEVGAMTRQSRRNGDPERLRPRHT